MNRQARGLYGKAAAKQTFPTASFMLPCRAVSNREPLWKILTPTTSSATTANSCASTAISPNSPWCRPASRAAARICMTRWMAQTLCRGITSCTTPRPSFCMPARRISNSCNSAAALCRKLCATHKSASPSARRISPSATHNLLNTSSVSVRTKARPAATGSRARLMPNSAPMLPPMSNCSPAFIPTWLLNCAA